MIYLTRLSGEQMVVNADLIATVEHTANTQITLVDGKHFVVATSVAEVIERVVAYRQRIARGPMRLTTGYPGSDSDDDAHSLQAAEHLPAVIALKAVQHG